MPDHGKKHIFPNVDPSVAMETLNNRKWLRRNISKMPCQVKPKFWENNVDIKSNYLNGEKNITNHHVAMVTVIISHYPSYHVYGIVKGVIKKYIKNILHPNYNLIYVKQTVKISRCSDERFLRFSFVTLKKDNFEKKLFKN